MKAREVEVSAVRQATLAQEKATLAKKEAQAAAALAKKRTAEVRVRGIRGRGRDGGEVRIAKKRTAEVAPALSVRVMGQG